jgi:carotenoid cleavage dioxygenase-like enzyme
MPSAFDLGFGVTRREVRLERLPVRGQLPAWLRGSLIRNGPGTFAVGEQRYRHWFDGLAMLHRFSFADGVVGYANKFLRTRAYEAAQRSGRIRYSEFATDPCRDLFGRVSAVFDPKVTDSAKVNIGRIAGRYLALAETPIQVEFDPATLETVGVWQYEPQRVGQMTTVHPQVDPQSGLTYNLVTRYGAVSQYRLHAINGRGGNAVVGSLTALRPAYLHSFGMSQRYAIVAEFPLVVDPVHLLLWLRPFIENFRWRPAAGTPFRVLDRHTGAYVGRWEAEPFFAFHHVNAFERGDELIVDLVGYDDAEIIQGYYLQRLAAGGRHLPLGTLRRYRLPLRERRGRVRVEPLSDTGLELPRFAADRFTLDGDYRYVYGIGRRDDQPAAFYNQLVKIDARGGPARLWAEPGCYPGEGVFVGAPDRRAEDDGVVLSVVLDEKRGSSFLLVLDAASFEEIARADLPHAVLFGYHGEYFEH